jgi:inorganic pyrophosphatase
MRRHDVPAIPARDPGGKTVNVVVETVAGSRSKYKFDERLGLFRLHKLLPVGASFPFDFGFIPGTLADDGDALDVLLLNEEPTHMGCLVTTRILGVIEAEQTEKGATIRNDRLIGTAETAKIRPTARTLGDLPARLLDQIEHFFSSYNRAEGRDFVPIARRGPRVAERTIEAAIGRFRGRAPRRPRAESS